MDRKLLPRFAWLSIAAALLTIGLKYLAYYLTGSVGLLSDAIESVVNLVGASLALAMLTIAARPADEDHLYGHSKAEYFSSGAEGILIVVAAVSIGITAVKRMYHPQPLEMAGTGLILSVLASVINLIVARILMHVGRKYESITLEADSRHLMTDVWTSAGVIAGVGAVALTGWGWLDPVIAVAVAINILWSGFHLMQRSVSGLMDAALPGEEQELLTSILDRYSKQGVEFHAIRTRQAAGRRFISLHLLVPGNWSVRQGHELAEEIEIQISNALQNANVITHLEPLDDDLSHNDIDLDR